MIRAANTYWKITGFYTLCYELYMDFLKILSTTFYTHLTERKTVA